MLSDECILEVNDTTVDIIQQCDGCHTVEEIVEWAAQQEGEPVEAVYPQVTSLLDMLSQEGVLTLRDSPDFITPVYAYDRPLSVIWEITYACNQKCAYCIAKAGNPDPDELSQEEIDTVLDELVRLGVGLINITGGEPLLKKDTVYYIARRASENGIGLELLTNGMLITPEVAENLYEAGVRYAQVSLDCARPEIHDAQRGVKGAWGKTVEGINNLKKAGVHVLGAAVITRKNLAYLEETRTFLKEIADTIKTGVVMPMGRGQNNEYLLTPEMYVEFLKIKNITDDGKYLRDFIFCKETCSIGTTPVIAPNGDVYPCMLNKYEELKLGNIRETSIQSIYETSDLLHELINWNVDKIEPCNTCWNRYYCGGGCRGCAFAYHGTIYKNDVYQCEARKTFARALLQRGHPVTQKALKALLALTKQELEE